LAPLGIVVLSLVCAAIAGIIIGGFFMGLGTLNALIFFAGPHAFGGLIGGDIEAVIVGALAARQITPNE
jgi:hypothetical protein